MIYSNTCAYAIRALCRLVVMRPAGYVLLDELCAKTDLPRHFMGKIFQDLVRSGLLTSAKGRGGGFALARKPEKITLYDIVAAVDGTEQFEHCAVGMARCHDRQPCPEHDRFVALRNHIRDYLASTTLAQSGDTLRKKLELIGEKLPVAKSKSKAIRTSS
ncbi:MAG: transcriptional regulator [Phycisphaeraceae bacterium]|nr:transcriptional regulator [Phycisphaeraceae bacterium]